MPRSYTEATILASYAALQAPMPGSAPTVRALASSLSLTPAALYRYFPSLAAIKSAAESVISARVHDIVDGVPWRSHPRLVRLSAVAPGLLWAMTRLDTSSSAPDDATLRVMTGVPTASPMVSLALLGLLGTCWRRRPDLAVWRDQIDRLVPPVVELLEVAADGAPTVAHRELAAVDPAIIYAAGDDVVDVLLHATVERGEMPSLRHVAKGLARPRSTALRSVTAEEVAGRARHRLVRRIEASLQPLEHEPRPVDLVLANWLPAVPVVFDHPSIVDVLVAGPADTNAHRVHQREVWAAAGAVPPPGLTYDDLTDVIAGIIMYGARRATVDQRSVATFVEALIRSLVPA